MNKIEKEYLDNEVVFVNEKLNTSYKKYVEAANAWDESNGHIVENTMKKLYYWYGRYNSMIILNETCHLGLNIPMLSQDLEQSTKCFDL